jgi:hypothetical protein
MLENSEDIIMKRIMSLIAVCLVFCSSAVSASSDIYLKITDKHGVSQVFKCPDGACVVNNLKKGTYQVAVEDRTSGKGDRPDRKMDILQVNASVVSPRDAATGSSTARRVSSPPTIIRKDMTKGTEIVIADDDSTLSVVGVAVSANSSEAARIIPQLRVNPDKK